MSRSAHSFLLGTLIATAVCVPATSAQAQVPAHVRVIINPGRVTRWLRPQTDVILTVDQGTTLKVIDFDQEEGAYWVILPPDLHGSRNTGWIRASSVEPFVPPPAAPREAQRDDAQARLAPSPSAPETDADKVAITVRHDATSATAANTAGAKKPPAFEDVHFERDRSTIRRDDIDGLRAAVTALKEDPTLVVTIEGHTCSLGTEAHNLVLAQRRANAVRDYLVNEGVPAERLLTVSVGEADAGYDNSREETRRLNRRVALVPKVQR